MNSINKHEKKISSRPVLMGPIESMKRYVDIYIDRDAKVDYEKAGLFRKIIGLSWIKPLAHFKKIGNRLLKYSPTAYQVKKYATNFKALELMYTYSWFETKGMSIITRLVTHLWFNILNCKAVRNRLKLVKKILKKSIISLSQEKVTIISLGSGSARAIIETIAELREKDYGYQIKAILVDRSRNALLYSEKLARQYGVADSIICVKGLLEEFIKNCRENPPDIVEMVGVMDYFDDEQAIDVVSKIYTLLSPRGILITCNIKNNPERKFLTRIVGWSMIYRDKQELAEIIILSGFSPRQIELIYEPLGIHGLVVATKFLFGP